MAGIITQWRERIALLNMILFFVVGGSLLWRGVLRGGAWPVYAMGVLFLVAGGCRFFLYVRARRGGSER